MILVKILVKLNGTFLCPAEKAKWFCSFRHQNEQAATSSVRMRPRQRSTRTVVLNVGGVPFQTSLETLRQEGSVLSRYARTSGAEAFIDRDPTHFRTILNYLRHQKRRFQGHVAAALLPKTSALLEELRLEAEFYGLRGLVRLVQVHKAEHELAPQPIGPAISVDLVATKHCSTAAEWVLLSSRLHFAQQ